MRLRVALVLIPLACWPPQVDAQVSAESRPRSRVHVVEPVLSEPGVVVRAARLRIALSAGDIREVELDAQIERVAQVVEHGEVAVVIGQAKYGWRIQLISLTGGSSTLLISCGQPRPEVSPDSARVAYVDSLGGSRVTAPRRVVTILDVARATTRAVFPAESVDERSEIGPEFDELWHSSYWGNFLWRPDGKVVLFVTGRGYQWWDFDLCAVELTDAASRSLVARRRLDFSSVLKTGHEPSQSCKFTVTGIDWSAPQLVRVQFDGCLFVNKHEIEVKVPSLSSLPPRSLELPRTLAHVLESEAPGGYTLRASRPWEWVKGIANDGSVLVAGGERLAYFSDSRSLAIDVFVVALESDLEASTAASVLRSSNRSIEWRESRPDSVALCAPSRCWLSTAGGLVRFLAHSGRVCVLVTAYGRDVVPWEADRGDAANRMNDAVAMADLALRRANVAISPPEPRERQ